jgi:pimeloyl-ACP methyl ester carboxylesterase
MERYADDLAGLLDAIGDVDAPVVVGLSMGGYIAFEFYRRHPQRVRALVLADTRAAPDTDEAARARVETAEKVLRRGSSVVADTMVEKLFAPNTAKQLREQWHEIMVASNPQGVAAALRAMARRPDSTPTLATINVPALVIVGEHDTLTPLAEARVIHEGIPGSKLEVIPGVGHMTPVEAPMRFVEVLRQFLESLA